MWFFLQTDFVAMGCLLLACLCIRLHRVPAHLNSYLQYRGKTERAKRSNDKTTKQNYKATRTLARSGQKNYTNKKKGNCTKKGKLHKQKETVQKTPHVDIEFAGNGIRYFWLKSVAILAQAPQKKAPLFWIKRRLGAALVNQAPSAYY